MYIWREVALHLRPSDLTSTTTIGRLGNSAILSVLCMKKFSFTIYCFKQNTNGGLVQVIVSTLFGYAARAYSMGRNEVSNIAPYSLLVPVAGLFVEGGYIKSL